MRRILPSATLICLLASLAGAQTVPLRSGEHDGFTRLVFADTIGRRWDIRRDDKNRVEYTFSDGVPDLETSRTFAPLSQGRLVAVSFEGGRLRLNLGCDCGIETSQIPSGHIVIDILDEPPAPFEAVSFDDELPPTIPAFAPSRILPIRLPLQPWPEQIIVKREAVRPSEAPQEVEPAVDEVPQVRFHPLGNSQLILAEPEGTQAPSPTNACPIEQFATDVLLTDPVAALETLSGSRMSLLDGGDELDTRAIEDLSLAYLGVGWGSEAIHTILTSGGEVDAELQTIAAALDDLPDPELIDLDISCGPATTTIALLLDGANIDWKRAEPNDLIAFLDSFSPTRWAHLERRIERGLKRFTADEILVGIGPPAPMQKEGADPGGSPIEHARASGTNEAAVEVVIATLEEQSQAGLALDEIYLVNALALRRSLPEGTLRNRLDTATSTAFIVGNRPAEVVRMVAEGQANPGAVLKQAVSRLEPEIAADFAIRLEPHLADDDEARQLAAGLFQELDLPKVAAKFKSEPAEGAQRSDPVSDRLRDDPWLSRDILRVVSAPDETWTERNRLADAILQRNAAPAPAADLANAQAVLDETRRLSSVITNLIRDP